MSTSEIDTLLEQYLYLLAQYTTLRSDLSSLQSSIYQNIARANFSAERGTRYGADSYDERMQATRRLETRVVRSPTTTSSEDESIPSFVVVPYPKPASPASESPESSSPPTAESQSRSDSTTATSTAASPQPQSSPSSTPTTKPLRDPIHQFGLLVPRPLRTAQADAIKAVEEIVPQIALVDAQMKATEIAIRRARKRARKAAEKSEKVESGEALTEDGRGVVEVQG